MKTAKLVLNVFCVFLIFCSCLSFAGISDLRLEGVIVSYNKNTVVLSQRGKRIKVSRKSIPKHFKLKTGKVVYAILDKEKFIKQLQESERAQRKALPKANEDNKNK